MLINYCRVWILVPKHVKSLQRKSVNPKLFFGTGILSSDVVNDFRPMGVFEMSNFAHGTKAVLDALVKYTKESGLISVIGK